MIVKRFAKDNEYELLCIAKDKNYWINYLYFEIGTNLSSLFAVFDRKLHKYYFCAKDLEAYKNIVEELL